jgi:hypothetical protein
MKSKLNDMQIFGNLLCYDNVDDYDLFYVVKCSIENVVETSVII